jgi:2-dehydro-3-deoxygluconokinase
MMIKKVFCYGELLLRMSPALDQEWVRKNNLAVYVGGAELNVALALAKWGLPVKYFTALPDNQLTTDLLQYLESQNIDVSPVMLTGSRIGLYYLPAGLDLKQGAVIYDRANSSFASLEPGEINWNELFGDCGWFHFSAINPSLNKKSGEVCLEAVKAAANAGLRISIDLNYRAKLWQYGEQPAGIMNELMKYCQVVMGNIWSAEKLLGIKNPVGPEIKTQAELIDAAGRSMKQIHEKYHAVETMAFTFRMEDSYFGVMQHGSQFAVSKEFRNYNVIDKVGSGDCFMAALIQGLSNDNQPREIIDFAAAAAVSKLGETGDATKQSMQQIKKMINSEWTETKI